MNKINGIILDGKVYEAVESDGPIACKECALYERCEETDIHCADQFLPDSEYGVYHYSPELTEKLNKK